MKTLDKAAVLDALRADLQDALDVMVQAARTARAAATHEEMKPENDKDTRGLEAGYLAGAQAARAAEMRRALAELAALQPRAFAEDERIAAMALVEIEHADTGQRQRLFLCPEGGGKKLVVDGVEVQVVTPRSPLGDALVGKRRGDVVEMTAGGKTREIEILDVA